MKYDNSFLIKNLTKSQVKSAVIGMVLGDSGIELSGTKTAKLYAEHHIKSEDYVQWKAEILTNICRTTVRIISYPEGKGFAKGPYTTVKFKTKALPLFRSIKERSYYDNRKTVDKHLIKCLSPLGLAIWYMDDGSLDFKGRIDTPEKRAVSSKCWQITFATHCFSRPEQEQLAQELYKKFGLIFSIQKQNQYFYLALSSKSHTLFWSLVAPYIQQVSSMRYKMPPLIYGQYRAEPVREGVETMYQPPVKQDEDIGRTL